MALHGLDLDCDRRTYGPVTIGSNTWIGGNVSIYPGVRIGNHCVVLPNAVVAHDVENDTMVGGVPARVIKHRAQPSLNELTMACIPSEER
jgi:acetyltransferase-like isoleucine patch superfamily enzyme